jgi:hypothetical protein
MDSVPAKLSHLSMLLISSLCLLRFDQALSAQGDSERESRRARQAHQAKASLVLEQVVQDAQTLKLPQNRIQIQALVASLLWKQDEARARSLFADAFQLLAEVTRTVGVDDPERSYLISELSILRENLVRLVSARDSLLALDGLNASRWPVSTNRRPNQYQIDSETRLESVVALEAAVRDPGLAGRIARGGLEKGLTYEAINVLGSLLTQAPQEGVALANELLRKIRSSDLGKDLTAINVAMNLLEMMPRCLPETAPLQSGGPATSPAFFPGEPVFREVLDLMINAAMQLPANRGGLNCTEQNIAESIVSNMRSLMKKVEQFAPGRLGPLQEKIAQFKEILDPDARAWMEQRALMQPGTVEDLLRLASNAPPELKDNFFRDAALKAANSGDYSRARRIADERIADPYQRRALVNELDKNSVLNSSGPDKVVRALELLPQLRSDEDRVMFLTQLASSFSDQQRINALELLSKARQLVPQRAKDPSQMNAQIQLAEAYLRFEPQASFEILERLISRLNELFNAAAVLEGFGGHRQFQDGEALISSSNLLTSYVEQCGSALGVLAEQDFEQAIDITRQLERTELRLKAQLPILQGVLRSY